MPTDVITDYTVSNLEIEQLIKECYNVSRADAFHRVLGYTCANDVSGIGALTNPVVAEGAAPQ